MKNAEKTLLGGDIPPTPSVRPRVKFSRADWLLFIINEITDDLNTELTLSILQKFFFFFTKLDLEAKSGRHKSGLFPEEFTQFIGELFCFELRL